MSKEKLEVFVRRTSGLVREISWVEAMICNMAFMGFLFVFIELPFSAGLYPGVHLPTSLIFVIPLSLCVALMYSLLSTSMPRTGGDYIFVGRILHPALGFMVNFYFTLVFFSWFGSVVWWIPQFGITGLLVDLGVITGNSSYFALADTVASPIWSFTITFFLILLGAAVVFAGVKAVVKAAWTCFIVTVIGIAAYLAVILGVGQQGFIANFNAMSGANYDALIAAAHALPEYPPNFTLAATFLGAVYIFLGTLGYTGTAYCAGEVKGKLSQIPAMLGAIILFAIIVGPVYALTYQIMGGDFLNAASHLYIIGDPAYTLPSFPTPQYLVVFATQNLPIIYLISIAFMATTMGSCAIVIPFLFVRNLFAWSFDRLLPAKIVKLDKRGNPYIATAIMLIAAQISNYLTHFTHAFDYIMYSMTGWFIATAIVSIAATVFPYRRKDIFELSPPIVKKRISGIPVLSILGAISFVISVIIVYATLLPAYAGILNPAYIVAILVSIVAGPIYYFIAYSYQKRRGIPVALAHAQLPPE